MGGYEVDPQIMLYDTKLSNYLQRKLKYFFLIVLFFLTTANQLIPFPLEKMGALVFSVFYVFMHEQSFTLNRYQWTLLGLSIGIALFSAVANISSFSFMIFFPVIGFFFAFNLSKKFYYLELFYFAIVLHIIVGLLLAADSYVHGINPHVAGMGGKGIPFLHSTYGLTSTSQSFGTLCISGLLIYYLRKDYKEVTILDNFIIYPLITIGIFNTFNRATFLAYFIILFFKNRKLLLFYLLCILILTIVFWDIILLSLFNTNTISSRSELLEGFNISFWQSHSLKVYLFGRGTNEVTANILFDVTWSSRKDIENGHAMLLHSYGFLGYLSYIFSCLIFVWTAFLRKYFYLASIAFYYLVVAPYITQEFVTSTFYIILAIFIYMLHCYTNDQSRYSIKPQEQVI
ncbi:hypothetical protein [Chitinophaga sp.]|uniref:hypothetical protein n=1 Tax=Chitinophaga sp. TaxID=1869181 RepID=UPI002F938333